MGGLLDSVFRSPLERLTEQLNALDLLILTCQASVQELHDEAEEKHRQVLEHVRAEETEEAEVAAAACCQRRKMHAMWKQQQNNLTSLRDEIQQSVHTYNFVEQMKELDTNMTMVGHTSDSVEKLLKKVANGVKTIRTINSKMESSFVGRNTAEVSQEAAALIEEAKETLRLEQRVRRVARVDSQDLMDDHISLPSVPQGAISIV